MSSIKARIYTIAADADANATPTADTVSHLNINRRYKYIVESYGKSYPAKWERIVIEDEDVYKGGLGTQLTNKRTQSRNKQTKRKNQTATIKRKNFLQIKFQKKKVLMKLMLKLQKLLWSCILDDHLSTWAKSINQNLASLEELPTLPLF
ncbi:hypothetical protein RIR_jg14797.t1 [Rhizophagus irregularis DAOM 181602=DAOM 197198]|nr:hypothetical protein RIR_jg14797.t1 [Rhizophagus irregularis DAOM 181602=DAOM 197198]